MIKRVRKSRKNQPAWTEAETYRGPANPIQQRVGNNTNLNGKSNKWTGEPVTDLVVESKEVI